VVGVLIGLAVYVGRLWFPERGRSSERVMAYPSAVTMMMLGLWFFLIRSGDLAGGAFISLLVIGA